MEILLYAKAPRADICSQFVSALRTAAGCVKRRSRRVGPMCPAAKYALLPAGHAGPALQGAAVAWGGQGRPPLHVLCGTSGTASPTHLVIASQSAPRSKCPWGTDWRGNPFPHKGKDGFPRQCEHWLGMTARQRPLDKPAGMGIIINTRGRCDKRSAPELVNDFNGLYSPQKPSPARVAVFAFQSLDSYRDRMTQNMNRKNEKHVCHPLTGL